MIRILFVEDDSVLLSNFRRVLAGVNRKWEVRFAATGEEALVQLDEKTFDVIVTDLTMPGITGTELLSIVQFQYPHMVRVMMSDDSRDDAIVRASQVAHRLLRKPCDPDELSSAIIRSFDLQQRLGDPDLIEMINGMGSLPSPPLAVMQLNELLAHADTTVDDIASVVLRDPGMTAKLLQIINSAYFHLAHRVTEVREAIAYLGTDAVRSLLVANELLLSLQTGSSLVQSAIDEIHDHSLTVAHIARELVVDKRKANDAYVSALLHDVGLLVFATQMPEKFLEMRVQTMRCNLELDEVEMEVMGAHHSDVGAYLLDLWGLPSEIVEAVARHHDAEFVPSKGVDAVHAVHIANAIAANQETDSEVTWENVGDVDDDYLERLGVTDTMAELQARF